MNHVVLILVVAIALITLVTMIIIWWFREYKNDDYTDKDKYGSDFYTLTGGVRDEDSW